MGLGMIDGMKKLIVLVVGFAPLAVQGQAPELWQKVKEAFPDAPAAYVDRSYELTLRIVGDSLTAFTDVSEDLMHLRENTESVTRNKVYGSHFTEVTGLEAATLVWDKSRYRENQVSSYKKNSDRDRGIFFDDSYYYTFDFPSVAMHNRTVLKYRQNHRDPRFLSGFIFGSYLPQLKASYTVRTTKAIDLHVEVLNDPDKRVQMTRKEQGNNVTYTWTIERIPSIRVQGDGPDIRYYVPHLALYVKSYETRGGRREVLPNLDALYRWYWTFVKDLNKDPGGELPGIVEKLKKESKSEQDLVRRIFYWVQDNIQYVAFEDGMRGLIPHSGAYTCEKKYGDCKDMANMIVNMLQIAGITAYPTWIGTRDLPYAYSHWPTPIVDNHMIATYISPSGEYVFIDGTSKYTPLGLPSSMIQGKEALIALNPDKYEVRVVPEVPAAKNVMTDSMFIRLEGTAVLGGGNVRLTGYPKVFGDADLDEPDKETLKKEVTALVSKGNNKFNLLDYSIRNQLDRESQTRVAYTFSIPDYVQKAGTDLFVNLNLNKDFYSVFMSRATRPFPKESDYRYTETHHTVLEIPEGFTIDELPPNSSYAGSFISHELAYRQADNKIFLSRTLVVDYLLLDPSDFDAWNNDIRKLSDCYKESLMLRKK